MLGRSFKFKKVCCNPINLHDDDPNKKGDRQMSEDFVAKNIAFNLTEGYYICDKCRKEITKRSRELQTTEIENEPATVPETTDNESSSSSDKRSEDDVFVDKDTDLKALNESLSIIGESPVKKQRLEKGKYYKEEKAKKIQDNICSKLQIGSAPSTSKDHTTASASHVTNADEEIVNQLKEKFNTTEKRSEKLQILTVLPKSWSRSKIQEEFKVTQYMARQAKNLVKEKGVMALPNKRLPTFSKETENIILHFYKSEEISRIMPGKKDYKSVRKGGFKIKRNMAEDNASETPKRKRGRPAKPESEKKQKVVVESTGPKRGRGRPKGSKNKAKKISASKGGKRGRPAKVKESASEESAEDAE